MKELYEAIVFGKPYKTIPVDAKEDTILAKWIMDALLEN